MIGAGVKEGKASLFMATLIASMLSLGCVAPFAFAGDYAHELSYTGDESEFVAAGSDLFSHVESGLPGDRFEGKLLIANESEVPCEFFTATKDVATTGPADALERIGFTMSADPGAVLFDSTLQQADGDEAMSLGVVAPGDAVEAAYAVTIPADLTNEYADAQVGLDVLVSVVERPEETTETAALPSGSKGSDGGASLSHTGDDALWSLAGIACGALLVVTAVTLLLRRKGLVRP